MKKSFKSLISILTIAMMLLAMVPTAMAASKVEAPIPATISIFRDGVETAEAATVLTDDYYYAAGDCGNYNGVVLNDGTTDNTSKVITFNSTNSGIMWSFGKTTQVKRIDLWVLTLGGVNKYDVQSSMNGVDWTDVVTDGTLDTFDGAHSGDVTKATRSSYYPVIFPAPVTAKYIRFKIDEFITVAEETTTAYIAEARIYNTNEINLGRINYFNGTTDAVRTVSPYLEKFVMSNKKAKSGTYGFSSGNNARMWVGYSNALIPYTLEDGETAGKNVTEEDKGRMWWATTVNESKIKINRIKPNVEAGTITGIRIWTATDNSVGNNIGTTSTPMVSPFNATGNTFVLDTEISCNITSESTDAECTFDIPNPTATSDYIFEFLYDKTAESPQILYVDIYALADYEVNPGITKYDFAGTVDAGETVTLNLATKELTNANAKVYFAVYSGDELKAAQAVGCPFTGTATYSPIEYTIPSDAGDNLTLKVFIWDGTTLKPLLETPVVAAE